MKKIKYLIVILFSVVVIFGAFSFMRSKHQNKDVFGQHLIQGTWFLEAIPESRLTFMTFDNNGTYWAKKAGHKFKGQYSLSSDRQTLTTDRGTIEIVGILPNRHIVYKNDRKIFINCYRADFIPSKGGDPIKSVMCPFTKGEFNGKEK
jgi:hypothetical protein